jgi:hypothetical protein
MPRPVSIRGQGERPPRDPPAPTRRAAGGIGGNPSRATCGLHSKGAPGRRGTDAKPPTPLGFSTRHRPASRRTREEPGAGAGTPTSLGTPSTRQGHHLQPPLVGRGRSRPRRGRESDRSRDPYIAGNAYLSTPPPFSTRLRLHHRGRCSLCRSRCGSTLLESSAF